MSEFVKSFETFEDMQRYMREQEEQANVGLHPRQIELRDDTEHPRYWMRPIASERMLIFGHAYSFKESCEASAKYVPNFRQVESGEWGEAVAEAVFEIRQTVESRTRGYVYGWAYSQVEPQGELGGTHVANVWPISREAFEEAREAGWRAIESEVEGVGTPTLVKELYEADKAREAWVKEHGA